MVLTIQMLMILNLYTQPEEVAYAYEELSKLVINLQLQQHLEMCMVFINQEM